MMRQMDSMMSSVMRDPFGGDPFGGLMGGNMLMGPPAARQMSPAMGRQMSPLAMNPMALMNSVMSNMDHVRGDCSSQVFSSSSMMTMTTGPDGRPQVFQTSMVNRAGPGGVRETQHAVSDSRSGVKKLAIGHHIGDRGHIIEKERNPEGEEERREFLNIDEEEAEEFEREFKNRTGSRRAALGSSAGVEGGGYGRYGGANNAALAIEDRPRAESRRLDNDVRYSTPIAPPMHPSADPYSDRSPPYRHYRPNTSYTPCPSSYTRPPTYSGYTSRVPASSRYSGRRYSSGRTVTEAPRQYQQDSRSSRRPTPYN